MNIYDLILKRIREIQRKTEDEGPVTNISASSMLVSEITLISSILIAVVMLRLINNAFMIVAVLMLFLILVMSMPLMPKLKEEQGDSFKSMVFYVILALGIIITLFYWGNANV
jgi:energy-converting hydrogenase B subunit G